MSVGDAGTVSPTTAVVLDEEPVVEVSPPGPVRHWWATHPNSAYVIRRFGIYVLTLWAAITVTFFFFRLIPGNPIGAYIQNLQQNYAYNAQASAKVVDHYKEVFGLNGNLLTQYLHFMRQLVFHLNFGPSLISYPDSAQSVIAGALPWTVGLLLLATIIGWILGVAAGAFVAWRRNSPISEAATYVAIAAAHIPFYFVGLLLLFALSFSLAWFPSGYAYSSDLSPAFNLTFIGSVLYHGILPALSIVIVGVFGNMLGMRQQMITVLGEDYLTFARAKGLMPWHILRRYAVPNCYLPQVTGLLISFGFIFNGNILLENLFNYPGVGHLLVTAIQQLDLNTVMGITDIAIFVVITAVFVIDLILPLLDPRIKYTR
ncbi:ABC transporter permease [Microlunatus endophyticus]|uniref:ABC transporter permease n=1 Tax=Microlunatus endophyticus TaxID=1716077 RepID=UPI001E57710E|nr:ABC transporter permease [Microlunatus endophyticus]